MYFALFTVVSILILILICEEGIAQFIAQCPLLMVASFPHNIHRITRQPSTAAVSYYVHLLYVHSIFTLSSLTLSPLLHLHLLYRHLLPDIAVASGKP